MEATGGFEPPNRGFADLRLNHLATSPRAAPVYHCRAWADMVPRAGLEPTRAYAHGPLKTACLPIPPPRPVDAQNIITHLTKGTIRNASVNCSELGEQVTPEPSFPHRREPRWLQVEIHACAGMTDFRLSFPTFLNSYPNTVLVDYLSGRV